MVVVKAVVTVGGDVTVVVKVSAVNMQYVIIEGNRGEIKKYRTTRDIDS